MSLIEVEKLRKVFVNGDVETVAVDDATFTIERGEFVAIMGPSGSGKSTLLHMLGFLDPPSSGVYRFDDRDFDEYEKEELAHVRNKKLGFVFQAFNLLARQTVFENVKLPLMYSGLAETHWEKRATDAIESVGLGHRKNHMASQLSGGEKQRVAIARALVNEPNIIFADEPTGNLDSKSGKQVLEIIQSLNKDKGHTIILITHEHTTAEHAERIIKMIDGKVVLDERVENQRDARSEYIK